MAFWESLRLAFDAILGHKMRSFLTLLGIILGVAVVIFMVELVEGFNTYVSEKIADLGSNAFIVNRLGMFTSLQEFLDKNKRNKDIKMEDLEAIKENPIYVKDAAAMAYRRIDIKYGTKDLTEVAMQGVSHNMIDIDTVKVAQGRYITREDENRRAESVFIGKDVANHFFPTSDPLGKELKVDGRPFIVIGVAQEIGTVFGQSRDNFVTIPITTFQKIYGSRGSLMLRVAATGPETFSQAIDEVRVILRSRRHLNYNAEDNFGIITSDAINNLRDQIFGTVSIVAILVASVALFVGGIVIMNMMLVSVTERTREIGIRKSLGARRTDILRQFLAESTILSILGGALGVLLALGAGKLFTMIFYIPTSLPLFWTIMALTVSAGVGLFFGIYPAWKAAKLDPITALRFE